MKSEVRKRKHLDDLVSDFLWFEEVNVGGMNWRKMELKETLKERRKKCCVAGKEGERDRWKGNEC